MTRCDDPTCWPTPHSRDDHTDPTFVRRFTALEHHVLHCESRLLPRMAPLAACPFRAWHDTQEPR